ncbi:MAG: mycofactocin precursor [Deltaproteobacteria bacterium]|nr:mycofactocin precursor [Deltaproteobacteria bacterium]
MEGIEEKEKGVKGDQRENEEDGIFKTEEIVIEEMAIDGICGVY